MANEGDRHSKAGEDPEVARTPEEIAAAEARNALRQFDRLREMVRQAVGSSRAFRLRPSALMELNRLAIDKLHPRAGAYRTVPIEIGGSEHEPPPSEDVPGLVDDLCDYVNAQEGASAVHLAAYVMWRLNWIHPFYDGNGRTTRAASYLALCARLGHEIPGTRTIPEIIASHKQPYYDALGQADSHCAAGRLDVTAMEGIVEEALAVQLASVLNHARSPRQDPRGPAALPGIRPTTDPTSSARRGSVWGRQPRWVRFGAKLLGGVALVASIVGVFAKGAWELLINWDNPRVQQVRTWLAEEWSEPAAAPGGDAPKPKAGSEAQP